MERERRILDAAAALFFEKGFHGVGIDELGTRAGLSGPAIYRHFGSKNEILAALFDEAMDELMAATAPVHDDPAADLERMVRHHVAFAVARRPLVNVYQREDRSLQDPWRRMFTRRRRTYVERWEAAVARAVPTADRVQVAVATQSCLGTVFSIAYWPTKLLTEATLPGLVEQFVDRGIAGLQDPGNRETR